MRLARRVSQLFFLAAFLWLFALTLGSVDGSGTAELRLRGGVPADLFLRLDPLAALSSILAARSFVWPVFLWALPVVVLAILAGRAFCGWVCPLGTCIDASDRLLSGGGGRRSAERSWPRVKYYVLAGVALAALMGSQAAWFLDPLPLLFRSLTLGVFAPLQWAAGQLSHLPVAGAAVESTFRTVLPESQSHFRSNLAALLILTAVLAGGVLSRRFWCRTLCPLGALLGVIARLSVFRRHVSAACRECSLCRRDCRMDSVAGRGQVNDPSECIYCYSCVSSCPRDAVCVAPAATTASVPLDLDRRRLLAAMGLGGIWALSARTELAGRPTRDAASRLAGQRLIRPPGSAAEEVFRERCIRCGACMKVCPTNGLQPALLEGGLGGIWTPVLMPRVGECAQSCSLCGQVCPTEAIEPFTVEEKEHLYIGRAVIDRSVCVVWESGKDCLVCDEVCSYQAIYWKEEGGVRRPHVDEVRCVGCGICENNCPAGGPVAAIRVTCEGDRRSWTREEQRRWRLSNLVQERRSRVHAGPAGSGD